MKSLAERLRHLRMEKGMNQSELARHAGTKPQVVQLIEAGKVLQSKHLFAIAHVLETSAEWLLTGSHSGAAFAAVVQGTRKPRPTHLQEGPQAPIYARGAESDIPIYNASGSAKSRLFTLSTDQIIGHAPAHPRQQRMNGAFAFYCIGDSMAPRYEHGDLIYCLPHQPLQSGQDVLITFVNNQQAMLARLIKYDRAAQKMICEQFQSPEKETHNLQEVIDIFAVVGRG